MKRTPHPNRRTELPPSPAPAPLLRLFDTAALLRVPTRTVRSEEFDRASGFKGLRLRRPGAGRGK